MSISDFKDKCERMTADFKKHSVRIGIFADNDPFKRANIAAIHSRGVPSRNLPEREFLKRSVNYSKDKIEAYITNIAQGVVHLASSGKMVYPLLNGLGRYTVDNVVVDYLEHNGYGELEPLKATTIMKKGNNKILQDKLHLIKALTSKVGDK